MKHSSRTSMFTGALAIPATRIARILVGVWAIALLSASALAQDRGAITGIITDPSGGAVPAALVRVKNISRGEALDVKSTAAGQYTVTSLIPGTYEVTVEAQGFRRGLQTGIEVRVAEVTRADFQLQVGDVRQTVTVRSEAPLLKTESSDIGTVVQREAISNLPLFVGAGPRDPLAFVKLTPGFNGQTSNSAIDATSYYTVNGSQQQSTQILVDGADVELTSPQMQFTTPVTVEAVEEFKVMSSNFSAEYGRSTGGIINLTLKSGTNDFHGSLYEFLRNDVLDARGFFNPERIPSRQNDFGGLVSGPVRIPKIYDGRDKTFFMFSYEGFKYRQAAFNSILTLPIASFRTGDFSQLVDASGNQIPIYDPNTTVVLPDGTVQRQQFPGNVIPPDRIGPFARAYVGIIPDLTYPDRLTNNMYAPSSILTNTGSYTLKVDHALSARQKLTGTYSQLTGADAYDFWPGEYLHHQWGYLNHPKIGRLADDFVISPTVLNHFQLALTHKFRREGPTNFTNDFGEAIHLPNADTTCLPIIDMSVYNFFATPTGGFGMLPGGGPCQFFVGVDTSSQVAETLSAAKGKHSLKFGAEIRKQRFDMDTENIRPGYLYFSPSQTGLPGSSQATGDPFASFLIGTVSSANWNYSGEWSAHRFSTLSLFAQDDVKASPRLTLNLGLRYDRFWPLSDATGRISSFDPNTPNPGAGNIPGALIFGGTGTGRTGSNRLQEIYNRAFGPRAGLAYKLTERTVIRAGYGIYYADLKEGGYGGGGDGFFTWPSFSSPNGFTPAFQMENGFPMTFPIGPFISPTFDNGQTPSYADPKSGRPPIAQNWQLSIQRQLAKNLTMETAYVATKGDHLITANEILDQVDPKYLTLGSLLNADINSSSAQAAGITAPYPGFSGTVAQALRPFPQYQGISTNNVFCADKTGNSTYHALQLKVQGKVRNDLTLSVAYTYSKNLNDNSNVMSLANFTPSYYSAQNGYNRRAEKTYAAGDIPQNLVIGYVYDLPFGTGKAYLMRGVASKIAGGWSLGGVLTYQSGVPIPSPYPAFSEVPLYAGQIRPNRVAGVPVLSDAARSGNFDPGIGPYLNVAAWSSPDPFSFGNAAGMSGARIPALLDEDVSILKTTPLTEKLKLQFRAEAFNVANRTEFGFPNLSLGSSGFGTIASQQNRPRTIQFGLKLLF